MDAYVCVGAIVDVDVGWGEPCTCHECCEVGGTPLALVLTSVLLEGGRKEDREGGKEKETC